MRIHLIAIGGAVMHNMAMALHNKGFKITGSDDEIFEPSKSRLDAYGLLPKEQGWNPDSITSDLDGVILGMHARKDNPELIRAQELGLKIWSFPEYIYEQSKEKKRVVIGGSHGKTTVTSMIMHALWFNHYSFDYMVGSQLEGFETMVKLSDDAPIIILEGDEYLSSPIDLRPKFHLYKPHVAVLTGIAWDHMNVFPSVENYLDQFRIFASGIEEDGKLFWYDKDLNIKEICKDISCINSSYSPHEYIMENGQATLVTDYGKVRVPVFGNHNMQNIAAALLVCKELGMPAEHFYEAISSFKGASRRQQRLAKTETKEVYLDFAHAPSKVKATLASFREAYPDKKVFAFLELHTFSSLNKEFMPQYSGSLNPSDQPIVFYNPEVVEHKKLPPIAPEYVKECFGNDQLIVVNDKDDLRKRLHSMNEDGIYLFMSSGNFSGLDIEEVAKKITE